MTGRIKEIFCDLLVSGVEYDGQTVEQRLISPGKHIRFYISHVSCRKLRQSAGRRNGLPGPGTCTVLPDVHSDTSSILFNYSASWRDIRPDHMVKDG